jgi:hypothetical protein
LPLIFGFEAKTSEVLGPLPQAPLARELSVLPKMYFRNVVKDLGIQNF